MVACDENWSIDCRTYWKQLLSFADFIVCNLPLKRAFETLNCCAALLQVFLAHTTVDPFTPKVETAALERFSHQSNHISFGKPKLKQNGLKWGPVFPCHFNDAVLIDWVHGDDNNCLLKLLLNSIVFLSLLNQ